MNIGGYEFEGPIDDPADIALRQGVYAVICIVDGAPHCVLYIGTSGQLRERLSRHHKYQSCWREYTHGDVGFCVKYTGAGTDIEPRKHAPPAIRKSAETKEERLIIEDELQWKFNIPCGSNHWKEKEKAIFEYNTYEQHFGPRGHNELG